MIVAVTYDNGSIFQHFGHSSQFKIYTIGDGKIKSSAIVSTNGSGHGALADFLKKENVDTLICGGIGEGAQNMLAKAGIKLFGGVSGSADEAVADLLADRLSYNPDITCNHHGGHGHGDGHSGHDHGGHDCSGHCHD